MKRLGSRIKSKREVLGVSLGEVAKMAGISSSALSQIENAKVFPSIVTLKGIANAIGSTVGELIGENDAVAPAPLVKNCDKILIDKNNTGAELHMLSHREQGRIMGAYLLVLKVGASSGDWFQKHTGQEFNFVLEGKVKYTIDDVEYPMQQGDSLYSNSQKKREVVNETNQESIVLWVITPPYF